MTQNGMDETQEWLTLRSRLSEIAKLPPWIESLTARYSIPQNVQSAINVCLEETVSNSIRHGYGEGQDRPITVRFTAHQRESFIFIVEDEAPHFNPIDGPDLPAMNSYEDTRIGGLGIRLLRRFADDLQYEEMPGGNRLRLTFSASGSTIQTK